MSANQKGQVKSMKLIECLIKHSCSFKVRSSNSLVYKTVMMTNSFLYNMATFGVHLNNINMIESY